MKILITCLFLFYFSNVVAQSYQQIHQKAILVDTHNDILSRVVATGFAMDTDLTGKAQSDLARWKKGGLDVQFFSVFSGGEQKDPFQFALRQIDSLDAVVKRNPDKIVLVATSTELYEAVKADKIAAMFGVEGGHQIENDLTKLDILYKRGARYMTLTWNNSTDWASSASDETAALRLSPSGEQSKPPAVKFGLNDFGKQLVVHMNKLGMMIDISHVGEKTFWDVIATTKKPIIASHSSVYHFSRHQRNLKDEQIKAVAKNGGVVQVNFYSGFLDSTYDVKKAAFFIKHQTEVDSLKKLGKDSYGVQDFLFDAYKGEVESMRPPLSLLIDHIAYIVKLVGVDYVGIGSDYDGIESVPVGLDDVSTYPLITKALLEKGYSEKDIDQILGGNLLRVLKANEKSL